MPIEKILLSTIPVFIVVAIGYLIRRLKVVTDESESSMMRLVINVLYPCFILSNVPGNKSLQSPSVVVTTIAVGAGLILGAFLLCYLVGRALKITKEQGLNTFCVATAIQNYGFIPIPLIQGIFPKEQSDQILGVLFVHSLGVEIALWTVGIMILSGSSSGSWKRLLNGPTIAIAIGLFLNFTGLFQYIPEVINRSTDMLGLCAIPVSLILVGASLGGVLERERWENDWRVMTASSVLRFAILPIVFIGVVSMMTFSPELQTVLLVQAAMPTAIFPIVLAKHFGGLPKVAVQVCLTTSLLSLILTPVWLKLGLSIFSLGPIE
jgi:predicted permease